MENKIKVLVVDWCGRWYKITLPALPNKGDDLQVGVGGDKHVRGIVSNIEHTVSEKTDHVSVYIADDEHALNEDSDYNEVNWW